MIFLAPQKAQGSIPDFCDIAAGTLVDADGNGIPDVCEGAWTPYCFGFGSGLCGCGNVGDPGSGCDNSFGTGGGRLRGAGIASVSADTLLLQVTGLPPTAPGLYFQGPNALTAPFGDGILCIGGPIIRLKTKVSTGGASTYPEAGDTPISIKGALPPAGGTRRYQVWYRNAAPFCTPDGFNLSNGLQIDWGP